MSERMPGRMSDRMPERMPDTMPDKMPDRMSDRMSDRMPEYMPDRMSENMSDRMPDRMSDRRPESMSDRMPDTMLNFLSAWDFVGRLFAWKMEPFLGSKSRLFFFGEDYLQAQPREENYQCSECLWQRSIVGSSLPMFTQHLIVMQLRS